MAAWRAGRQKERGGSEEGRSCGESERAVRASRMVGSDWRVWVTMQPEGGGLVGEC